MYQFYQQLKTEQLRTPNITRMTSYCFGPEHLQNYSIIADESVFALVSISFVGNKIQAHLVMLIQNEEPHIFLLNARPRMSTFILCAVRSLNVYNNSEVILSLLSSLQYNRPITMGGSTPTMPGSS